MESLSSDGVGCLSRLLVTKCPHRLWEAHNRHPCSPNVGARQNILMASLTPLLIINWCLFNSGVVLPKMKSRQNSTFIHWISTLNELKWGGFTEMFTPNTFFYCLKGYDIFSLWMSSYFNGSRVYFLFICGERKELLFLPNDKQKRYSFIIEPSYFILVTKVCRDDIHCIRCMELIATYTNLAFWKTLWITHNTNVGCVVCQSRRQIIR